MSSLIISVSTDDTSVIHQTAQLRALLADLAERDCTAELVLGMYDGVQEISVWVRGFSDTSAAMSVGHELREAYNQNSFLFLYDGVQVQHKGEPAMEYVATLHGAHLGTTMRLIETPEPPPDKDHTQTMYGTYLYELEDQQNVLKDTAVH